VWEKYFKNRLFQAGNKGGKTFLTNIIPSKVPLINEFDEEEVGLPTMFVATPLKDEDDTIIGVVTLRIHVGTLSN
jgi:hypothetical protein